MSTYLFIDGDYLCGNFLKQMQRFYGPFRRSLSTP